MYIWLTTNQERERKYCGINFNSWEYINEKGDSIDPHQNIIFETFTAVEVTPSTRFDIDVEKNMFDSCGGKGGNSCKSNSKVFDKFFRQKHWNQLRNGVWRFCPWMRRTNNKKNSRSFHLWPFSPRKKQINLHIVRFLIAKRFNFKIVRNLLVNK